jgi:hypothetical protein
MATLRVRFERNPIREFPLMEGGSLTIGRAQSNDIVIENLGASGHHAKIDCIDGKYLLTDLKSKNGTFVNEELVTSRWLEHEDIITIAKHTLFFSYDNDEQETDTHEDASEKTMILDTDRQQFLLAKSYQKAAAEEIKRDPIAVLSFLSGGRGETKLTGKFVKIGKDPLSDIVVKGFFVGKTAATISNRPSGYYLSYVGGMSRPKLNGQSIAKHSVKLEEFDVIELASVKMQFVFQYAYTK